MNTENITIEQLAEMIHEGFKTTATKEDIAEVNGRLDRIEKQILADYGRRIESLEQELKRLKGTLTV
jgi:hypothetical protein